MKLSLLLLLFALIGCATAPKVQKSLSLTKVESLKSGVTSTEDAQKIFGQPSFKILLSGNGTFEVWSYYEKVIGSEPRLNLNFDPKSKILREFAWLIQPDDAEANLEIVKKRYPNAKFQEYTPDSNSPHVLSDELINEDEFSGLVIVSSKTLKRVQAVSWGGSENRTPTTDKKAKPWVIEKVLYDPTHFFEKKI